MSTVSRRFRRAYDRSIKAEDITHEYTAYHYLYVFLRWFRWVPLVKALTYRLYHNGGMGQVGCLIYHKGRLYNEKRIRVNELNLVVAVRLKKDGTPEQPREAQPTPALP